MKTCLKMKKKTMFLYMLPGLLWYSFIILVPVILAAYYGCFDWSGGINKIYIGMDNFVNVVKDPVFIKSLVNNIYLTVVCLIGQIGIAFVLAFMPCSVQGISPCDVLFPGSIIGGYRRIYMGAHL